MFTSDSVPTPLPRLQDYDIDPLNGFLPSTIPLTRLPDPYYKPWEDLISELNQLLLIGTLRERVLKLPLLKVDKLTDLKEYQRTYVVLSFITHAYIWGKNEPVVEVLPACIDIPFCKISDCLGLPPVMTYASSVLWNWRLLDPELPIAIDNIIISHTYSGSTDEMWFYLNTVYIECIGGKALDSVIKAISAAQNWDLEGLSKHLAVIAEAITSINKKLVKMPEKCDPYVFYWKVRPYLAGWENMQAAGLPHGIIYEGVDCPAPMTDPTQIPPSKFRQYAGGSAGQSSLIQVLDIFLGINHYPTSSEWREWKKNSDKINSSKHVNYLMKIRDYMPNLHRQFLYELKAVCDIRTFIDELRQNNSSTIVDQIVSNYNQAISNLEEFRDKHIQIVTRYITLPARKGPLFESYNIGGTAEQSEKFVAITTQASMTKTPVIITPRSETSAENPSGALLSKSPNVDILYPHHIQQTLEGSSQQLTKKKSGISHGIAKHIAETDVVRGTGGTDLIPFLKQARDETFETRLN